MAVVGAMNTLLFLFWSSFLIALTGAMMPGPVLTATIGEATRHGARAGPLMILGHGIVEVLLLGLILAGTVVWLAEPRAQAVLGMVGGAALIAMGAATAVGARGSARVWSDVPSSSPPPAHGAVLMGIVTTCSNPYWYLWWATVGVAYASRSLQAGLLGLMAFFGGHMLADLGWYSLVAAGVAGGRRWLSARGYVVVLVCCGVVLVGLGAWFAWTGIRHFT